ncbi:MAG: PEP-CTERM system histidine kinase PrsK [Candidatus Accumulibacter sp.]|nr:PEP-CTERM system histidine kinase PrsK [Accumulibacter sp.]
MEAGLNTLNAWSYGLTGFVFAAFAIFHAAGWKTSLRSRTLFLAVVLSALWGVFSLAFALTGYALFLASSLFFDLLRYGAWFCFLLVLLLPDGSAAHKSSLRWNLLASVGLVLLAIGVIAQALAVFNIGLWFPPRRVALLDALAVSVFALVLLEQLWRNVNLELRWSIKPLCLGLGGAILFDLYLFSDALLFGRIDNDAFSIRGFAHTLTVPLVALSTSRSKDWKKRLVLSQRAALQSASLVAVGVYLVFMSVAGYYVRYFGGEWGRALQLALLFSALLLLGILGLSGALRAKFRVLIGKHFFSYRYDYREEWLRFTNALSAPDDSTEMGRHVIKGLANMVESPAGSLWLKDSSRRFYAQSTCWNVPETALTEDVDSRLCVFLTDSGWIVNLEEYRVAPHRYTDLELPAWLIEAPDAWLVIPLPTGSEMIGFVILATARTAMEVNWEVNDLLKTAGRQAGAFLGQTRAAEALLEARKFDAFNRMSAFVVHDLKNIVAQLSLMLKNAERHRDNPEFQQDMLMTVEHAVERMRQLMMQLREGATPLDSPRGIDLGAVIRRIQAAKSRQGREIEIDLADKLVAKGHEDRVERVIGHVVQNALDATEQGGQVRVRMEKRDGNAAVLVRDTGHGMSPEFLRERLFKPFQTTKPAGMGIGAYESFQYVHELGGKISVDSEVNVGTQVSLLLPLFDVRSDEVSPDEGISA